MGAREFASMHMKRLLECISSTWMIFIVQFWSWSSSSFGLMVFNREMYIKLTNFRIGVLGVPKELISNGSYVENFSILDLAWEAVSLHLCLWGDCWNSKSCTWMIFNKELQAKLFNFGVGAPGVSDS